MDKSKFVMAGMLALTVWLLTFISSAFAAPTILTSSAHIAAAPSADPVLVNNNGLTVNEGASATITSAHLQVTDADNLDSELLFTVTITPAYGSLSANSFTQQDINDGLVSYQHNGSETPTADSFIFTVTDGIASIENITFNITITPVNDNTPTFTSTGSSSVSEDNLYLYNITTSDTDPGDTLSITAPTKPAWLLLIPTGNGTATLSGTPTNDEVGFHSVMLQVQDAVGHTATQSFSIQVINVNDAPVLDNSGNMTLTNINEDNQTSSGDLIVSIIASAGGDRISDVDTGAQGGLAIIGADNTNGIWQYSTNNGGSWSPIGSPSNSSAVLLNTLARIRYVPNQNYSGSAGNLTFRAWDRTTGANGATGVDVSINGGTTAFSAETETATLTVVGSNDAPVLDNTGNMVLPNINEDNVTSSGDTVTNLIASAGGDRITDVDLGAVEGIALTGANNSNGAWQYSINGGASWNNLSGLSDTTAVLLNPAARIRYVPTPDYNGSAGNITFRAWDQTSGSNGSTGINVSVNGGASAFSLAAETATLSVISVNDIPVLDLNGPDAGTGFETTFTANGGPVPIVDTGLSLIDIDHPQLSGAAITIANEFDGAAEILEANTSGTSILASYNAASEVLTLSGIDTVANYEKVLRTITYNNTADDPYPTQRQINFIVDDGLGSSLVVTALVNITKPAILLTIEPSTQTVGSGGTATFTVHIINEGNADLTDIVTFSPVADCEKDYMTLDLGETKMFVCTQTNVTQDFTNNMSVTAKDPLSGSVGDSTSAQVNVENPNISIVQTAVMDTVVRADTATIGITVRNKSNLVTLNNAVVSNDIADDCDKNIGTLSPNQTHSYTCHVFNVQSAFDNTATVTATNPANSQNVTDSDVITIDMLGLNVNLTPNLSEVLESGALVQFTVMVTNDGSKDVALTTLNTNKFGDLTQLESSDCEVGGSLNKENGTYSCVFEALVVGSPPTYAVTITASAEDNNQLEVNAENNATITIIPVVSDIEVTLTADPLTVLQTNTPITFSLQIENKSPLRLVTITTLTDSLLGDLADLSGDCTVPTTGIDIDSGQTYSCIYHANFQGHIGNSETHIVIASGLDEDDNPVSGNDQVVVRNYAQFLTAVRNNYRISDEPNDRCEDAYPLELNQQYDFLAEDKDDWYEFELTGTGNVTAEVTNFAPTNGQAVVYSWDGVNCNKPSDGGSRVVLKNNAKAGTDKTVALGSLPQGHYLILIINDGSTSTGVKYRVRVRVS